MLVTCLDCRRIRQNNWKAAVSGKINEDYNQISRITTVKQGHIINIFSSCWSMTDLPSFFISNFIGMETDTQLTITAYQCQCLQDTFAFVRFLSIDGTVLEWRSILPSVSRILH